MKARFPHILAAVLLSASAGCSVLGIKKEEVPQATLPAWIGRVVMVDSVHRFALVDIGAAAPPAPGTAVVTLRDKRPTAALRVTEEARPPYIALEVVEGQPALGDQALLDESHRESPPQPVSP